MICCLNPHCSKPLNPDTAKICQNCGEPLVLSLRNRYCPVKLLGQGGFGRTYLALDRDRLDAYCVIKQFSPQVQGTKSIDKAVQLFNQEAVRLYELGEHPQIPTLLAYFEQDQYLYLVQQYIEGQNLLQELNRLGPFDETKIREILMSLLPVLQFIHDHQVIHRDITPTNILRRKTDQRLMLIDFGVAKQLSESLPSQPGTRIGTEGYSPMEQFRGGRAFPASDIYSLGATCVHLITQAKPDSLYDPMSGEWLWRQRMGDQGRQVSDAFASILNRMLKDLVNERYQSANEVLHDLSQSDPAGAAPGLGRSPSVPLPPGIPPRGSSGRPPGASGPPASPSGAPASRSGMGRTPASSPRISGARNSGRLTSSIPGRASGAGRSQPTTAQQPPSVTPIRQTGTYQSKYCRCVYTLLGHSSLVTTVAANPMTTTFASGSLDDTVKVWNLPTGELLNTLRGHSRGVNALAFTPDGKFLISGSDDYTVKVWDVYSGRLVQTLTGHIRDVTALAVSPDGKFLITGGEDRAVRVWQLATGKLLKTPFGVVSMVKALAVSPNNSVFVSGGLDSKLRLWSMQTAERMSELSGHMGAVHAIAISSNSQVMVSAGKDRIIRLWQLPDGKPLRTLSGHSRDINAIAISPDNRLLLSGSSDKTIRIWDIPTGNLVDTLMDHSDSVNSLAMFSDNKTFVSASSDKTLKVWRLRIRS